MGAKVFNILQFLLFTIGRRIPLEEVPEDEQECSNWLHKLYQEKVGFLSSTGGLGLVGLFFQDKCSVSSDTNWSCVVSHDCLYFVLKEQQEENLNKP